MSSWHYGGHYRWLVEQRTRNFIRCFEAMERPSAHWAGSRGNPFILDWAPFEVMFGHDDEEPRFPWPVDTEELQSVLDEVTQLNALQFIAPADAREIRADVFGALRAAMG